MACACDRGTGQSAGLTRRSQMRPASQLRLVFHQPLRQTEGLLRSIADVLGVKICIPDHTTLSRRGRGPDDTAKADRSLRSHWHLLIDRTGLKIYGEGEWLDQKHGIRSRPRKLHIGRGC